jgi:hypothetical protein
MNILEKLSLYWNLVEADLSSDIPMREKLGSSIREFITTSDNKTLTKTARDFKNRDGKFKGRVRIKK